MVGLESCDLKPLEPKERKPSLETLSLPPEILRMMFTQLSSPGLKKVKAANALVRSHVVSIPEYQTVQSYAPALLRVPSCGRPIISITFPWAAFTASWSAHNAPSVAIAAPTSSYPASSADASGALNTTWSLCLYQRTLQRSSTVSETAS